ncbi:hypothetical protein P3T18_001361 [Paraburkholderia sp. GAS199]
MHGRRATPDAFAGNRTVETTTLQRITELSITVIPFRPLFPDTDDFWGRLVAASF